MNLLSFEDFINEGENTIKNARRKMSKANKKSQKYDNKARASSIEIKFRKDQIKFEREKAKVQRDIESASDQGSKGMARDKMKILKSKWKSDKVGYKESIKQLRT